MGERVTLYVRLLDEGTEVYRPVQAQAVDADRYRVLGPIPKTETWEFQPGDIVAVKVQALSGGEQRVIAALTSS